MTIKNICLIGFGEVGQTLAADLQDVQKTTWDILFSDPKSIPSQGLNGANVSAGVSCEGAIANADLVVSAVNAAETLNAASDIAAGMKQGTWYFDLNSASPGMKNQAAKIINDASGRYVEGAVMAPVGPKRVASPILLGGPFAEGFASVAHALGFSGVTFFSSEYGKASAAKMCRSVMVKGVEALLTESLLSARHYGVEDTVINSLSDLFPGPDWTQLSAYMISRSLEHGARRAEEMREVARTVVEARVSPLMSMACAERQDWAASRKAALTTGDLAGLLDNIIATIDAEPEEKHYADH